MYKYTHIYVNTIYFLNHKTNRHKYLCIRDKGRNEERVPR